MKKITFLLVALIAGSMALQVNAQPTKAPAKAPMRSSIYNTLPSGYQQVGETSIYYSIANRYGAGFEYQYGISILGKIGDQYYSSTYGGTSSPGAGFITALQVNGGTPSYLTSAGTTTISGVSLTPSVVPSGDVAARIVYTITNNNSTAVTVNVGAYADIYIGTNDYAPLSRLVDANGNTYALDLKESTAEDSPLLCVLFGNGITGVTAADDYWFGYYRTNYEPTQIVGNYSSETLDGWGDYSHYYMVENGSYDSAMGMCWKNRTIEAGETIELSYMISVGNIDFDDPVIPDDPDDPEPGEDRFTYNVEAINFAAWNDLSVEHPARVWGYYAHPYGQNAYLEYNVDDENTWHQIGELTSGEDYDFNFNMLFNENRDTDHVLRVRFTLGLGNYTELDGLSWIDVRSYDVTGFEDRVYNGEAQVFEIAVNGGETSTYVGETYPGTYDFTIEGVFDDNTIAVKAVDYSIDKAECVYDVEIPERTEYDGEAHGATVTVPEGSGEVTVTYVNTATGERSADAPIEVGNYLVIVTIAEGEYYYGIDETSFGPFEIYSNMSAVEELTIDNEDNGAWYTIEGIRIAAPTQPGLYIHNGKKYVK